MCTSYLEALRWSPHGNLTGAVDSFIRLKARDGGGGWEWAPAATVGPRVEARPLALGVLLLQELPLCWASKAQQAGGLGPRP